MSVPNETPGSTATEQPKAETTKSTGDEIIDALKAEGWTEGTQLTRAVAETVGKKLHKSPASIYGHKKKFGIKSAQVQAPERTESHESDSSDLSVELIAVKKVQSPGEAKALISLTPANPAFEEWTAEEIKPLLQAADKFADMAKMEHGNDSLEPIADLWAKTLNAFKIRKGEEGAKYLVLVSAVGVTLGRYGTGLRAKAFPPKTAKTPEPRNPGDPNQK